MKKWIVTGIVTALAINLWAQAPEGMGAGSAARYVDNNDGTVTDTVTGLMWTKNANHGQMTWAAAVKYCDKLVTNGYSDWRLSSVAHDGGTAELATLFRDDGYKGTPFTGVQHGNYWSGSSHAGGNKAWYVPMPRGYYVVDGSKADSYYVWPVRGGTTDTPERIIRLSGALDFGVSYLGGVRTEELMIYNYGNAVLTVTGIRYSDARFSGNWSGKVLGGGSTNITVTFAPALVQGYSGTITVNCDKTRGINSITCTGKGVAIRYVDNGDGTVTDPATGLMWAGNANHGQMTWSDAVTYCANLVNNGYSDWRLPSVAHDGGTAELDTLFRENGNPAEVWAGYAGTPFTGVQRFFYWSGTSYAGNTGGAWGVNMSYGNVGSYDKAGSYYVWPVRGGR